MKSFNRADLQYRYYWSANRGDDPKLRGAPDNTLFNRHQGYEVLHIINKYMERRKTKDTTVGKKAETAIYFHLSAEAHTHEEVMGFLKRRVG